MYCLGSSVGHNGSRLWNRSILYRESGKRRLVERDETELCWTGEREREGESEREGGRVLGGKSAAP